MVISALESTELALESGLRHDQIIFRAKLRGRRGPDYGIHKDLSAKTEQPLHLGLDTAWDGMKGQIWSRRRSGFCSMKESATRLNLAYAQTGRRPARRSLRPVRIAAGAGAAFVCASVTACPGCGRTTSTSSQELAESVQGYIRDMSPVLVKNEIGVSHEAHGRRTSCSRATRSLPSSVFATHEPAHQWVITGCESLLSRAGSRSRAKFQAAEHAESAALPRKTRTSRSRGK